MYLKYTYSLSNVYHNKLISTSPSPHIAIFLTTGYFRTPDNIEISLSLRNSPGSQAGEDLRAVFQARLPC